MPPDQAAGLRRRCAALTLLSPRREAACELAAALGATGARVLVVVECGARDKVSPLFDWRSLLARGGLPGVADGACERIAAPGCAAGEPALLDAARGWHWLVFDGGWPLALPLAGLDQRFVIEAAAPPTWRQAYAYASSLWRLGARIDLVGEGADAACDAALRFHGVALPANAHFAALAARMTENHREDLSGIRRVSA